MDLLPNLKHLITDSFLFTETLKTLKNPLFLESINTMPFEQDSYQVFFWEKYEFGGWKFDVKGKGKGSVQFYNFKFEDINKVIS